MIIPIILLSLLLILLLVLFAVYRKVFYYPDKNASETEPPAGAKSEYRAEIIRRATDLYNRPYEPISIRSYDGLTLCGRYYHYADGAPLSICFHGYHGSPSRDFCVIGPALMDAGHNVILIEERAHCHSGGHTIAYGLRERRDLLGWLDYANARFGSDTPIYLFGVSMGGGTVLMASGYDLPDNVRAICADCPLNDPLDSILHVSRKVGFDPRWSRPLIILAALIYGRLNIRETSAEQEVKKTKTPILIIHGEADDFVPATMSAAVRDANPAMIEYHTFPGADHGMSYFSDPDRYLSIVFDFLRRHP
jgi:hypothetical protein